MSLSRQDPNRSAAKTLADRERLRKRLLKMIVQNEMARKCKSQVMPR